MLKGFKYIFEVLVMIVCIYEGMSCAFARDTTFLGKVINADTKEPIEGAVIVAYWYEAWGTPAGETTRLRDVKETMTDRKGEWAIAGPKGRSEYHFFGLLFFIPYTRQPEFVVFKPGYCPWPKGFSTDACKEKMKSSGEGELWKGKNIELPALTKREDRLRVTLGPIYPSNDKKNKEFLRKQIEFLKLINEERRNLDLDEYTIYKELKDEK